MSELIMQRLQVILRRFNECPDLLEIENHSHSIL